MSQPTIWIYRCQLRHRDGCLPGTTHPRAAADLDRPPGRTSWKVAALLGCPCLYLPADLRPGPADSLRRAGDRTN